MSIIVDPATTDII